MKTTESQIDTDRAWSEIFEALRPETRELVLAAPDGRASASLYLRAEEFAMGHITLRCAVELIEGR